VYCEKNEYPKLAATSRSQKQIAPGCFYRSNAQTHFPNIHPADGSTNILRILGTNWPDNTQNFHKLFVMQNMRQYILL